MGMVKLTRLKDVRRRKALTQQQLAERAGVNRVTIARIEGGTDEPFPTTIRKVADALGVQPDDLFEPVADATASGRANAPVDETTTGLPLDTCIAVVDQADVDRLLQSEPDLRPLINEAAEQLRTRIPDARFELKVLIDPEYVGEELFLGVATDLDEEEALDRFDREWWVHNVRRGRGLLVIDLT